MASNPFTAIDQLIADQFENYAPLTAVIPAAKQQAFERLVDIRGDLEEAADFGGRLVLIPRETRINPGYSSGSARIELEYEIFFGVGQLPVEALRKIEWAIIQVCTCLYSGRTSTGGTLPANLAAPLTWEQFIFRRSSPERRAIASASWRGRA